MSQRTCTIEGCGKTHRAKGYCATHYNRLVMGEARRHPRAATACSVCATPVIRRVDSRYSPTCSVQCRTIVQWGLSLAQESGYDWRTDAVGRARDAGATVIVPFDREDVFVRDDWTCAICSVRCSSPNPYVPTAATIDHVIPLSLGGHHTVANAQTCCLSCNSSKQDSIKVESAA